MDGWAFTDLMKYSICQHFNFLYETLKHGGNIWELAQYYEHSGCKKLTSSVSITRFSKTKRKILLTTKFRLTLEFYDPGPAFR